MSLKGRQSSYTTSHTILQAWPKVPEETICRCWREAHLRLEDPVEPFRLANGNPQYELNQVYESIRVQLRTMPAILFLDQQDLQCFVISPEEYIPERQPNLCLEEIAAAYSPLVDHPPNPKEDLGTTPDTLDDSEPRPPKRKSTRH